MQFTKQAKLIQFLKNELLIPQNSISLALRQSPDLGVNTFAMVLLQYGLITLEQLDKIFDWLETV
ncbi:DUF2949 domain-containing protein [Oscillatoriales cyanobacterium LEGE 11467]|uniref:DUF2949 domain-containing protein n=1 Tax=Zarconia navalis LEGE 11467 TaxID=1828826 RepID=A0A928Z7D9_9CYAN|nr:DUF2949 domain-containing protein [Zarconia navalis]MBE9041347.1 DUF2949 domain-containing protein [Zarconia navalis LEGE 11467]